jgi:hypothetical protein
MTTGRKLCFAVICFGLVSLGASTAIAQRSKTGLFVGYELLEMSMNEFRNFAGEVGYRFNQDDQLRFVYMDVQLTERHLSSEAEATAVDGDNVEGTFLLYEISYDNYFGSSNWYWSLSAGHENTVYRHTELDEEAELDSASIGAGVGYLTSNFFWVDGLLFNFSIPVRYYLDPLKETKLGDTTIREHTVVNNIWVFVGYHF